MCLIWALLLPVAVAGQQSTPAQQAFQQGYAQQTGVDGAEPDLDLALRYYGQALRLDPLFYEAHANAGQIYYQRRKYKRAKYHFGEAIKLARSREDISEAAEARVASDLGGCYFQRDELKEAERWLRGAVGLDPTLAEAHYNLINLLLRQDRIDEARQQLAIAQREAPSESYGKIIGRLQTKDSYADWNPVWLKVVIGIASVVVIALLVLRAVGTANSKK